MASMGMPNYQYIPTPNCERGSAQIKIGVEEVIKYVFIGRRFARSGLTSTLYFMSVTGTSFNFNC